mmetsp:Transcript_2871/g.7289  ORF Transcript_2871/g.7289 Transcript_2871/m.7289 type:complete len:328 (-) Transcript_2871:537-1520(-)
MELNTLGQVVRLVDPIDVLRLVGASSPVIVVLEAHAEIGARVCPLDPGGPAALDPDAVAARRRGDDAREALGEVGHGAQLGGVGVADGLVDPHQDVEGGREHNVDPPALVEDRHVGHDGHLVHLVVAHRELHDAVGGAHVEIEGASEGRLEHLPPAEPRDNGRGAAGRVDDPYVGVSGRGVGEGRVLHALVLAHLIDAALPERHLVHERVVRVVALQLELREAVADGRASGRRADSIVSLDAEVPEIDDVGHAPAERLHRQVACAALDRHTRAEVECVAEVVGRVDVDVALRVWGAAAALEKDGVVALVGEEDLKRVARVHQRLVLR